MTTPVSDVSLLIERGGYVMIPLLILSAISLALILERAVFWFLVSLRSRPARLAMLAGELRRGDVATAAKMTSGDRSVYGTLVRKLHDDGASDAVAMEAIELTRPRLERFMVVLSTIITAAPLLGILGTVIGIIQSFELLGAQTTLQDPADVAGGIAAALLTTALGLIIALFTLFPHMLYRACSNRALSRMEMLIAAAQQGADVAKAPSASANKSSTNTPKATLAKV